MLFKPEAKDDAKTAGGRVARGIGRRMVSLTILLLILGGLGYLGWNAFQQKPTGRGAGGVAGGGLPGTSRLLSLGGLAFRAGTPFKKKQPAGGGPGARPPLPI